MTRTVLLDIDECLADQAGAIVDFAATRGFTFQDPIGHPEGWHAKTWFGAGNEDAMLQLFSQYGETILAKADPVPGAHDALHALSGDFRLVACTGRKHVYRDVTEQFLERHFAGLIDDLVMCDTPGDDIKKHDVYNAVNALVLVDDLPQYLEPLGERGLTGLYLQRQYSWQIPITHPSIIEANGWNHAVELLRGL